MCVCVGGGKLLTCGRVFESLSSRRFTSMDKQKNLCQIRLEPRVLLDVISHLESDELQIHVDCLKE